MVVCDVSDKFNEGETFVVLASVPQLKIVAVMKVLTEREAIYVLVIRFPNKAEKANR